MVRTGPLPVERKADGRLASSPPPLTLEDIDKLPDGTAREAVMQLIFWAQWGNLPAVVSSYDRTVIAELGVTRILGAYDVVRPALLQSRPRIITERRSGEVQFVSIVLETSKDPPAPESFLMRRRPGGWRVVYDTLLERAIEAFALVRDGNPNPGIRARRSAERAARQYRDLYPSLVRAQRGASR